GDLCPTHARCGRARGRYSTERGVPPVDRRAPRPELPRVRGVRQGISRDGGGGSLRVPPISGTKGAFALLAYDPCVRRVYQPAPCRNGRPCSASRTARETPSSPGVRWSTATSASFGSFHTGGPTTPDGSAWPGHT